MKELSRTELATVKRTAANVKTFRTKKAKLEAQRAKIETELESINKSIDLFEQPIIEVTGGYTSEQVLNGEMDAALNQLKATESSVEEELSQTNTDTEDTTGVEESNLEEVENNVESTNPLPFEY